MKEALIEERMRKYIDKAKILMEALPYINTFKGITIVIKYGGAALTDNSIRASIIRDISLMKFIGFNPVVVHGGGPEINAMLEKTGVKSEFMNGLRITDAPTMEIVEMVLTGKISKSIAQDITKNGIPSIGISGKDANLLKAHKFLPDGKDIGFVGEVTEVNTSVIRNLVDNGFVPVISPIGVDDQGQTFNINADYAALAVASALKAEKLVFLTDVPGIMRSAKDPDSVIYRIKESEIQHLLDDGTISGGMIPKVECCIDAVRAGIPNVHILDGRIEHVLSLEIFTKDGIGTLIEKDSVVHDTNHKA
jgi:acetylglutamate kinase